MFVNVPWTDTDTQYTLPKATSSALGGVKIGYTASGRNYPIQLNSSGQMYVNVPWTDTDTNTVANFALAEWSVSYTVAGNSEKEVARPSSAIPSGYHTVSYMKIGTGNKNVVIRSFTSGHVYVRNISSSSITATLNAKQVIANNATFSWSGVDENE